MPKGRTPKSIEEHLKDGTYRKDRHGKNPTAKAKPAASMAPPASIPKELIADWKKYVADLGDLGIVTLTDLSMLERAFAMLSNAMKLQKMFDEALTDPEQTPSDIVKLQSGASSATATFLRLVLEVRRAVKLNPKPPEEDGFGEWLKK